MHQLKNRMRMMRIKSMRMTMPKKKMMFRSMTCMVPSGQNLSSSSSSLSSMLMSLSSTAMSSSSMTKRCLSSNVSSLLLFHPTEEHRALRSMLRAFVQKEVEPQAMEYNRYELFNQPLFQQLGDLGLLGLTIDEAYGGTQMDATAVAIVHEELSYSDPAFCLSYLAHSLLFCHNLHVNATSEAQKSQFLPRACAGTIIGGMAMSEPEAGTDVLGMKTTAITKDDGDTFILNGTKLWITNGTLPRTRQSNSTTGCHDQDNNNNNNNNNPFPTIHDKNNVVYDSTGDVFLIYARTGKERNAISQFLVEKDMPGFTLGQHITNKLGMRASPTAELVLDNVVVPAKTHLVGDLHKATVCMMRNLEIERIGLAAMALGIARRSLDEMTRYAKTRTAFGTDLYHFGQVQRKIAKSYAEYMAGRYYVYGIANTLQSNYHVTGVGGGGMGLDADGVKLYCANMAKTVADRAIQVMGGNGYIEDYVVERLWRDAKLLEIGGGTNESHHKNMARDLKRTRATTEQQQRLVD